MAKQPSKGRKPRAKSATATEKPANKPDLDTVEDAIEVTTEPVAPTADTDKPEPKEAESAPEPTSDSDVDAPQPDPVEAPTDDVPDQQHVAAAPDPVPPQQQSSTFLPLVIGGFLAGLIGYGFAYFQFSGQPDPTEAVIARINALEQEVANLPAPTDLGEVEGQIADIAAQTADIPPQIVALADRISIVERQPSGDGTLQEAAIAAYERDIAELRGQIQEQQANLQAMADNASNQLDATRAEALSIEQNAVAAARAATARAALARVQAAMESGAPIGAALNDLGETLDAPVPDALLAVSDGAPTLASLRDSFPAAARAALATARSEGVDGEEGGGFGTFLRNQFNVRSVTPQEGEGVDAILSRAEAALGAGRLSDALAEVSTLPEVSRTDLSEWMAAAEMRAAALDAADTLATTLDDN